MKESPFENNNTMSRIFDILAPEKQSLIALISYGILVSLLSLTVPVTVQSLVNSVAYGQLTQQLLVLSLLMFLVLSLSGLFSAIQIYYMELLQRRLFTRYALDLAGRIPRLANRGNRETYGAEFVNPFLEAATVHKTLSLLLLEGLGLILQVVVGLALLGVYHPYLLIFALSLFGVLAAVFIFGGAYGVKTAEKECSAKYNMLSWLEDMARMPILFHSASGETFGLRRADQAVRNWLDARRSHFRIIFRQNISMFLLHAVASSILLGIGGVLVIRGQLSLGQLVASEFVLNAALSGLTKFGKHIESYYDLMAAVKKLDDLRSIPLETEGVHAFSDNNSHAATLNIKDLTVHLPDSERPLFANFSMALSAGDMACIYGSGSSGKTILLECIYGLYTNFKGAIEIDGYNLSDLTRRSLRTRVALLGEPKFFHGTLEENLTVGLTNISRYQIRKLLNLAGLENTVARMPNGLNTLMLPHNEAFSSSELVRFALVRAILAQPGLILLDRSLDGLDENGFKHALEILKSINDSCTIFVATNRADIIGEFPKDCELPSAPIKKNNQQHRN
jgi:ABC-type bacteriocin/lantibiotic exporter with double-glycine peptidase domain